MVDPREMQAGPELDRRIVQEVFGWEWSSLHGAWRTQDKEIMRGSFPAFSSDPAASAELRAKLWEMGFCLKIVWCSGMKQVRVGIMPHGNCIDEIAYVFSNISDPNQTEFLAVARCALEAVQKWKGAANA